MPNKLYITSSYDFQKILWQVTEMVLNAQKFTLGGVRHFRRLKSSLQNQINNDLSKTYRNEFEVISHYYCNYLNCNLSTKPYQKKTISINNKIRDSNYNIKIGSFLREFKFHFEKNLSAFAIGCFLHGSLSTMDYTDFSDVDVGIIIKDEVMLNPVLLKNFTKKLRNAIKIILKFDNLQHHGFFIIPKGFLNNYPKDYLPSEVFAYSKALSKPFEFKIREYERPKYAREKLLNMAKTVIKKASNPPMNLYDLTFFLSQFMLLPTLYLQTKGTYIYKKYSFDIVTKEFPQDWWVMEQVSQIRQDWIRPKSKLFNTLVDTLPNPWMPSLIYKKMDWRIPDRLLERLTPELHGAMSSLAKKMSR